jgi:PKD repeat protein
MRNGTKGLRGLTVFTVVLTCLVVQAVFTLPIYGDEIVGWGWDYDGQATPPEGIDFIAIAAGAEHSLALRSDGSIAGWGDNSQGQANPPVGNDFIAVSTRGYHSLALKFNGSVVCWGGNNYGEAIPPEENNNFIAIAAGYHYSLALKADGSVVGWGRNQHGQATPPEENNNFIAIAAGRKHNLALKVDGSVVGWGYNSNGQAIPPVGNSFTAIAAARYRSLALESDGSIVGWGGQPSNSYGESSLPTGDNDFTAFAATWLNSLALKTDGSIVAWGHDEFGQATPPEGNNFTAIAAGHHHGLALVQTNSPPVANAGGPYSGNEGTAITFDGIVSSDPDGDALTYAWDFGDGSTGSGLTATHTYDDNGVYTICLTVTDPDGESDAQCTTATIANVAPTIGPIVAPIDPVQLGTADICAAAEFVDLGEADTHTAEWDWGDGVATPGTIDEALGYGFVDDCYTYTEAGIYTVSLAVTDDEGASGESTYQYVVVYDPSGGFVTGGGWIDSPAGAYAGDLSLAGVASFGFVSKYKKGAQVPTGNTEFVFQSGDLSFHSSSYQWLVVNQGGANAQFKGAGSINDAGDYKFMLWAGDGGKGDNDTFRIKIWEEDDSGNPSVIYDNGVKQIIGGGSIVIHAR